MKRLRLLTLCTVLVATSIFFLKKRNPTTIAQGEGLVIKKEWLAINTNPITPKKDLRSPDQTFLTFPEWYLVFSPEEQAHYFKQNTSTSFPFVSHIRQIWESYHIVNNQIKDNFPPNKGYHLMIWVIGTSASVEYAIKAMYEKVIGRITDTKSVVTDEDKFNGQFTRDYVDFIKDKPWYEFNFKSRIKTLWTTTSFFGEHFGRKMERKYILTSELLVKYVYGKLIGLGTKQVYEEAQPTTAVITNDGKLLYLPRYDKFNKSIVELARDDKSFKEIAGNTSAILLTVLVPAKTNITSDSTQIVFTQPIASDNSFKRIALVTPVSYLNKLLLELSKSNIVVEHVFDY